MFASSSQCVTEEKNMGRDEGELFRIDSHLTIISFLMGAAVKNVTIFTYGMDAFSLKSFSFLGLCV